MPRMDAGSAACARIAVPARVAVAAALLGCLLSGLMSTPMTESAYAEPAWTTYHRDAARSGVDPEATNPITPTLSWQSPELGAPIWSQPLILGSRVYVATVGNEIYALEASTGKIIWEKSAGIPVPEEDVSCGDIEPTVGIVGTPVIDVSTNTLYAVADVWDAGTQEAHHVLQGYDLTSGEHVLSTPVDPPGAEPKTLLERPALNIDEGKIVFGYGGNAGDCGEYRGAVVSAPEAGGPPSFWQYSPASPAYGGGAVWGTSGPAVDAEGHIYVTTGNPNFPEGKAIVTYDDSDSIVELNSSMSLIGTFEPESWLFDSNHDGDLSSSGPELLPGGLIFQAGKNEMGYLLDEATMGTGAPAVFSQKVCKGKVEGEGEGSFGGDAYSAGTIYVPCEDGIRALTYNQAARTFSPLWHGPAEATGPPIVSGGLVWVLSGKFLGGKGTKLYGLDPSTGVPRFTETLPSPVVDHFGSPSAAGGRVFVATGSSVTAYQIADLANPPSLAPATTLVPSTLQRSAPSGQVLGSREQKSPVADATLASTSLTAGRSGTVHVRIRCPVGQGRCIGSVTLRTLRAVTVGNQSGKKATILTLAGGSFDVAAGREITVKLRLSAKARELLGRARVLRASATIVTRGDGGSMQRRMLVKLR
jgi:outer membrane protein assembly factor BamB